MSDDNKTTNGDALWAAAVRETRIWLSPFAEQVADFGRLLIPRITAAMEDAYRRGWDAGSRVVSQSAAESFSLPTEQQREVGQAWVKKFGHMAADDPAFVAAAVYRVMMLARLEPDAAELKGLHL